MDPSLVLYLLLLTVLLGRVLSGLQHIFSMTFVLILFLIRAVQITNLN